MVHKIMRYPILGVLLILTACSFEPSAQPLENEKVCNKFLMAVMNNDIRKVRSILGEGADVNCQTYPLGNGCMHIMTSKEEDYSYMVSLLVSKGADINMKNAQGSTALKFAVVRSDMGFIKLLLKLGADKEIMDRNNLMAVDYASSEKDDEIIKLLK